MQNYPTDLNTLGQLTRVSVQANGTRTYRHEAAGAVTTAYLHAHRADVWFHRAGAEQRAEIWARQSPDTRRWSEDTPRKVVVTW